MEIDAGKWQGMLRGDIMAAHPDWAAKNPSPLEIYEAAEAGEGLVAFQARISDFLDDLAGPTVIVAHGLLGQVLRGIVRGLDMQNAGQLSNDQGCVYVLEDGCETVIGVER